MHGKQSPIFHDPDDAGGLFESLPRHASAFPACGSRVLAVCTAGQGMLQQKAVHRRARWRAADMACCLCSPFLGARYHSLAIAQDGFPDCLKVTAWVEDGTIMGVRHKDFPWIQARALTTVATGGAAAARGVSDSRRAPSCRGYSSTRKALLPKTAE